MMRWLLLVSISVLIGCSQRVVSYTNSRANFRSFESYRIVNLKTDQKSTEETSLAYELIQEGINAEMARRNYVPSAVSPDLTLRYELTSSTRVETNVNQQFYFPVFQVNSRTIHSAVLLLELFDDNKKLVWQGSYDLNQERKEKQVRRVIRNAIGNIFTTYPYNAKSNTPDPSLTTYDKKK